LIAQLEPAEGSHMIDVGCRTGRHCKHLASKGYKVTGIDLAFSSIQQAKKYETESLHFFQHDMRLPFGVGWFDYIFNFFTSFGYFKDKSEDHKVISNMALALKSGGILVLDYLNVQYSEERSRASEEKEIDGIIYHITRWMDDTHFFKRIAIEDNQLAEPFENIEQVSKLRMEDFNKMFTFYNLQLEEVYGDYSLNDYDREKSTRLIMIARKV